MLTPEQIEYMLIEIFHGRINSENLPRDMYRQIALFLFGGIEKGYGKTFGDTNLMDADWVALKSFETNVYRFSAAKTFQEVLEMQSLVFDDEGYKRSFQDFRSDAKEILKESCGSIMEEVPDTFSDHLKTEVNTAFSQAQAAQQWNEIQDQKRVLPYLTFRTVGDDRVREEHAAFEGICLPIDDPFWDENFPPLEWNCRCMVEQSDEAEITPQEDVDSILQGIEINDAFRFNAGKDMIAFSDAHPYFDVPDGYAKLRDANFNLPLPKEK